MLKSVISPTWRGLEFDFGHFSGGPFSRRQICLLARSAESPASQIVRKHLSTFLQAQVTVKCLFGEAPSRSTGAQLSAFGRDAGTPRLLVRRLAERSWSDVYEHVLLVGIGVWMGEKISRDPSSVPEGHYVRFPATSSGARSAAFARIIFDRMFSQSERCESNHLRAA
jgi:hypothetical protein